MERWMQHTAKDSPCQGGRGRPRADDHRFKINALSRDRAGAAITPAVIAESFTERSRERRGLQRAAVRRGLRTPSTRPRSSSTTPRSSR